MTRDANWNVHHLRKHSIYTPPPPDIEPIAKDRRGTEMIGGWCIVASISLVLVALALAVWPK